MRFKLQSIVCRFRLTRILSSLNQPVLGPANSVAGYGAVGVQCDAWKYGTPAIAASQPAAAVGPATHGSTRRTTRMSDPALWLFRAAFAAAVQESGSPKPPS